MYQGKKAVKSGEGIHDKQTLKQSDAIAPIIGHLYPNNLKMLAFRDHQCVQFEANFVRNSRSISVEFNDEVGALRASLRES